MPDYKYVTYETLDDGTIARIMLNRAESRNAQNRGLLVELDDAFLRGRGRRRGPGRDPRRRRPDVLVGPRHGLEGCDRASACPAPTSTPPFRSTAAPARAPRAGCSRSGTTSSRTPSAGATCARSPIAQVHGTVYAAGLMLMWACDLIVAADDARFADVVGTRLGMCGVEYFAHPWEFGPRKTKELMLTGDAIDVDEAHRLGMVSKVFPNDELADRTLEFARRIAAAPHDDRAAHQGVGEPDASTTWASTTRCTACFTHPPAQPLALGRGPRGQACRWPRPRTASPTGRTAPPIVLATKDEVRADA